MRVDHAESGSLVGRRALVTGGARGQGRAHAVRLARAGADVAVLDVVEQLDEVQYPMATPADLARTHALVEAEGRRCLAIQADVRDAAQVEAAFDRAGDELGELDVVVANAGIVVIEEPWLTSDAQWAATVGVNLTGVFHVLRAAGRRMVEAGTSGSIICTGSVCSSRAQRGLSAYTASKHGVLGLVRSFALELAQHGVRVNLVAPGNVDTPMIDNETMHRRLRPDLDRPGREQAAEAFARMNPMPVPWVESDDISSAVVWLASDAARYVTGVDLAVDAGLLLQ